MDVLGQIMQQFSGGNLDNLSNQLGVEKSQVSSAIGAAIPMIMGAMAKNAQTPQGAQSLDNALAKDHDGSLLENLSGFLGSADNGPGGAILGHVFGNNRTTAEAGLSKMTNLNPNQAGSLLENLAPVVMGYLGQQKKSQGLDAGGIVNILMGARNQASNDSGMGGMAMTMLNSFLDKDGDGSALDDIGGMLGNMFGKK